MGGDAAPTSSHGAPATLLDLVHLKLQEPSRVGAYGLVGIGIEETDEEEGHVVLPRYPPEAGEVGDSDDVTVAVLLVGDLELANVGHVVHVPAEDDRAEAKACSGNGEELLFGDQLAPQDTVDIDAGELDAVVILEQGGQGVNSDLLGL